MKKLLLTMVLGLTGFPACAGMAEGEAALRAGAPVAAIQEFFPMAGKGDAKAMRRLIDSYTTLAVYGLDPSAMMNAAEWTLKGYKAGDESLLPFLVMSLPVLRIQEPSDYAQAGLVSPADLEKKLRKLADAGRPSAQMALAMYYIVDCKWPCPRLKDAGPFLSALYENPRLISQDKADGIYPPRLNKYENKVKYFELVDLLWGQYPGAEIMDFLNVHGERTKSRDEIMRLYREENEKNSEPVQPALAELDGMSAFAKWVRARCSTQQGEQCETLAKEARERLHAAASLGRETAKAALLMLRNKGFGFDGNSDEDLAELETGFSGIKSSLALSGKAAVESEKERRKTKRLPQDFSLWREAAEHGDLTAMVRIFNGYVLHSSGNKEEAYRYCLLLDRFILISARLGTQCEQYVSARDRKPVSDEWQKNAKRYVEEWRPKAFADMQ